MMNETLDYSGSMAVANHAKVKRGVTKIKQQKEKKQYNYGMASQHYRRTANYISIEANQDWGWNFTKNKQTNK